MVMVWPMGNYSTIFSVNPPFHSSFTNNSQCNKFMKAMDTMAAIYADNWSLQLKRIWDTQAHDLYLDQAHHYSAKGLLTYWMAVDCTIKFWDTAFSPIHKTNKNHMQNCQKSFGGNKRVQWTNKFSWKREKCFWSAELNYCSYFNELQLQLYGSPTNREDYISY